jgi:AcrR family transcriptional regulator
MKKISLHKGRIKQKLNTRSNILDAAKRLLDKNIDFSIDDVAREVGFSRATVYRYYSDVELLKLETLLDFQTKISIRDLEVMQGGSLTDSVFQIQDYFNKLAQNNEPAFRMY